jgi:hypothetical protein
MEQIPSWEAHSTVSESKNFPSFMKLKGSLPFSQEPVKENFPTSLQQKKQTLLQIFREQLKL